ncbi:MAG TPA: hypothetical protein VHT34_00645 [Clostridia bacterium]|nr:hypothetical protein [Clostridia bacterium]
MEGSKEIFDINNHLHPVYSVLIVMFRFYLFSDENVTKNRHSTMKWGLARAQRKDFCTFSRFYLLPLSVGANDTIHGAVAPKINIVFIFQSRCNYNLKVQRNLFEHIIAALKVLKLHNRTSAICIHLYVKYGTFLKNAP